MARVAGRWLTVAGKLSRVSKIVAGAGTIRLRLSLR